MCRVVEACESSLRAAILDLGAVVTRDGWVIEMGRDRVAETDGGDDLAAGSSVGAPS
jgi:hypothetical protein